MRGKLRPEQAVGVALVLAIHAAALYGLWHHRLLPTREEETTLFVNFIALPIMPKPSPPAAKLEAPRPKPATPPPPQQLVAQAPAVSPGDLVAPPLPPATPAPAIEAPPAAPAAPAAPVSLAGELAVACPERTPPAYPPLSRRLGETGTVMLRVELDEQGRVAAARVDSGSGYERLDQAALSAVKTWRCQPPLRDGLAQRAVARQPFKFVLQGS